MRAAFILFFTWASVAFSDYWNGADYAQHSSVQQSHAERLLQGLKLQPNDQILDLGCGDGRVTALLADRLPEGQVIGIDPSDSML